MNICTLLHQHGMGNYWENIDCDFQETWNLPHVVGAIVGKHIRIQCSKQSETLFHSYEGFLSFVLLSICDACYFFILFNVGQYGSNNNAGVLANSSIGKKNRSGGNEYSSTEVPRRLFL